MSTNIQNYFNTYIAQFQTIQKNLQTYNQLPKTNDVGNEITSKIIGSIAGELFQSKTAGRIGTKLMSNKMKQEEEIRKNQFLSNQENSFNSIFQQLRSFLGIISINKNNLTQSGNSKILVSRLTKTQSYVNLETRVRKILQLLIELRDMDLILNNEIPKKQVKKSIKKVKDSYKIVKTLETCLRELIQIKILAHDPNWWKQRVPEDVRTNAEKRKKKNESQWSRIEGGKPLINFIDFTDYGKIITRKDNWSEIFRSIFENKEELLSKLKELEPIRNTIMHSRNLTEKQVKRLELYSDDLNEKMRNQL